MEWLRCRLLAVLSRVSSLGRLGWLGRNLVVSTCEKKHRKKDPCWGYPISIFIFAQHFPNRNRAKNPFHHGHHRFFSRMSTSVDLSTKPWGHPTEDCREKRDLGGINLHHWHPTFGTFLHSNGKKTIHGLLK
jgi:hypothetical protein